jgi:hypothetical protein
MLTMRIWISVLAFLTFSAYTDAALAQAAASATPSTKTADVDALAAELSNRFTPIRKGPTLLRVPLSYRVAAICNAQAKQTLDNYFFKSFSATGSILLTKPEQLPARCAQSLIVPSVVGKLRIKSALTISLPIGCGPPPKAFVKK